MKRKRLTAFLAAEALLLGGLTVAQAAFEGAVAYGENLPEAFNTVFGDRFEGAANDDVGRNDRYGTLCRNQADLFFGRIIRYIIRRN